MLGNAGSQEVQPAVENVDLCSNHEDCEARPGQLKLTKGFSAKEPVKGPWRVLFFSQFNSRSFHREHAIERVWLMISCSIYALKEQQAFTDRWMIATGR